jgi:aspartyl-tRNA(Asn)/glutamyl-tRNA(Gln) amidotransferase subunit C
LKIEITEELIGRVASLAKLSLSDEERRYYKDQFLKIISYFDEIDQVDTSGVQDGLDTKSPATPERADVVAAGYAVEDVMARAPHRIGTAFQVPKIIE